MLIDSHNYIPVCNICIFWQITQCMAIGLKIKITAVAFWDAMVGMNLQDVMLSDTFAGQRNGTAIFLLVKKVKTWTSYTQIHPCHRNKGSRCIQDLKTYLFTTLSKCPFKLQFFLLKKNPLPFKEWRHFQVFMKVINFCLIVEHHFDEVMIETLFRVDNSCILSFWIISVSLFIKKVCGILIKVLFGLYLRNLYNLSLFFVLVLFKEHPRTESHAF